jgi:hypothetical protein
LLDGAVELSLPPINSAADVLGAIKAVADAVGRGGITPAEGFALSQMIESFLRADCRSRSRRSAYGNWSTRRQQQPRPFWVYGPLRI